MGDRVGDGTHRRGDRGLDGRGGGACGRGLHRAGRRGGDHRRARDARLESLVPFAQAHLGRGVGTPRAVEAWTSLASMRHPLRSMEAFVVASDMSRGGVDSRKLRRRSARVFVMTVGRGGNGGNNDTGRRYFFVRDASGKSDLTTKFHGEPVTKKSRSRLRDTIAQKNRVLADWLVRDWYVTCAT